MNFYNDNDPKTAAWLRELIACGHVGSGPVDERSIWDLDARELSQYRQCHFFAGIGGWPLALRWAGWPDNEPVWTGSCPCQPFSQAGQRKVDSDERHLWPAFRAAIAFCRPPVVLGEQVASKDGRIWLAGIRADLEALGYAVGAADLCAAGVGAPHIRQRLFWVAYAERPEWCSAGRQEAPRRNGADCEAGRLVQSDGAGREPRRKTTTIARHGDPTESASGAGGLGHANSQGRPIGIRLSSDDAARGGPAAGQTAEQAGPWSAFDILPFKEGKFRRVESRTFPLAHGIPGRVGLLRGYGNAIVPALAAEFIKAAREAIYA